MELTEAIVDGKIMETWRNADDLGRILQLGGRIGKPREESTEFHSQEKCHAL